MPLTVTAVQRLDLLIERPITVDRYVGSHVMMPK